MFPFEYSLNDTHLVIKMAGYTVRKVAYSDIESVVPGYTLVNEQWTNFFPLRFVTIQRKTGMIKNLVVNPVNADGFIAALQSKIADLTTEPRATATESRAATSAAAESRPAAKPSARTAEPTAARAASAPSTSASTATTTAATAAPAAATAATATPTASTAAAPTAASAAAPAASPAAATSTTSIKTERPTIPENQAGAQAASRIEKNADFASERRQPAEMNAQSPSASMKVTEPGAPGAEMQMAPSNGAGKKKGK